VPNYFSGEAYRSAPGLIREVSDMIRRQTPQTINAAMHAIMERADSSSLLTSISCPALVMCGTDDRMTPPETAEGISVRIRGSKLVLLGGAGHISNLEQPDAFNRALIEFLHAVDHS